MKIALKNFQSISDAEVEIGPLTVLVGQSDVGKSAVIRALYLLHRNQGGLELVKHGKSALEVTQVLDDGTKVAISKGRGLNTYKTSTATYAKVGREVPEAVSKLLGSQELVLDKDQTLDLNFCRQFDAPFLLSDSTTVITKAVSSLSGINIIYAAMREGTSDYQKVKAQSELLQSTVSGLMKYEALSPEAEALVASIQEIKKLQAELEARKRSLESCKAAVVDLEALKLREVNLDDFGAHVDFCLGTWKDLQHVNARKQSLEVLKGKSSGISAYALSEEFDKDLQDFITRCGNDIGRAHQAVEVEKAEIASRRSLLEAHQDIQYALNQATFSVDMCTRELRELESQIKVCPTCQRPL